MDEELTLRFCKSNYATDGYLYATDGDVLESIASSRFDFERAVCRWLKSNSERVAVRHFGDNPSAAACWHVVTSRGKWRPLAIRTSRDGTAYSRLIGQSLVAID